MSVYLISGISFATARYIVLSYSPHITGSVYKKHLYDRIFLGYYNFLIHYFFIFLSHICRILEVPVITLLSVLNFNTLNNCTRYIIYFLICIFFCFSIYFLFGQKAKEKYSLDSILFIFHFY